MNSNFNTISVYVWTVVLGMMSSSSFVLRLEKDFIHFEGDLIVVLSELTNNSDKNTK